MQEMHDTRPIQLVPYNPRWSIPEDLQEVIDACLSYESEKRGTAQGLTLHNGLATGKEFVLQHLLTPAEYEATLKANEWHPAQLNSSTEGPSNCASITLTTVKVKTHITPRSHFNCTLSLSNLNQWAYLPYRPSLW